MSATPDLPNPDHVLLVAKELSLKVHQVAATAQLLKGGATVPFISRYRKEATGELDEVQVTAIRDRMEQLQQLDDRRAAIVASLTERNLLTDALKSALGAAATLTQLEDIYLPFRPKKRTRATIAREKSLEPLADLLWAQDPATDPVAVGGGGGGGGGGGKKKKKKKKKRKKEEEEGGVGGRHPLHPRRRQGHRRSHRVG
jgi:protein Tex